MMSYVLCREIKVRARKKDKATVVNLKTGRFDNIGLADTISSVCKAVQNCKVNKGERIWSQR